jgi:hypothetical protein
MKIIIFILIWIGQIEAESLIYPNGKVEHFTQHIDKSRALKNNIYYKNGIISNKTRYYDTRKIYVSFGGSRDLTEFCQKYNLKFLKITNKKFYTALFELQNNIDIITLCSKINVNENIRYAKPHWKTPRILK